MDYREVIKASIVRLVEDFQSNPFDYLYEADIQAMLFAKAREEFKSERVSMEGGYHSPSIFQGRYEISTTPVKCEYPSSERFDIAVIDPRRVESYDRERWLAQGWKNDRFWGQPLCAAVEIKYMQLGDRLNPCVAGLNTDLKKLASYQVDDPEFCGIAMLFVQAQAPYSEDPCASLERIDGIAAVGSGIYAAIVGPSDMAWFRVRAPNHSLQARRP